MLENNSTRLIFAAIAVVIGGIIYGTVNATYPEATNQIIKKIQAPFDDSNNSDENVTVSQYAQKTINVYVPYAIVPGQGILMPYNNRTSFGDDYYHTYSMKDSNFIKDKYHVNNYNGSIYSDYSLDRTISDNDNNGTEVSQNGFYNQSDIAPLSNNGTLFNINIGSESDKETSIFISTISNNTNRKGSLEMSKLLISNAGDGSSYTDGSYGDNPYIFSQNGVSEKTSDFIEKNNLSGPFVTSQVPIGAIISGWSQDDYINTTVPKDSSIDGFYILNINDNSVLSKIINKNGLPDHATLQYVGKIHINFHFVDVGYDQSTN